MQTHQRRGFFLRAGLGAEILGGQIGKTKLVVGRKFVGQRQLHAGGERTRALHQLGGRGFVKAQQGVGGFHFAAFAAVELHLQ